jgi:hypothetical protein
MMDQSHLDKKYFIDGYKYNCPFCKRGSVSYSVVDMFDFDWSSERTVWAYKVKCDSCENTSLHLSDWAFYSPNPSRRFCHEPSEYDSEKNGEFDDKDLDEFFFYHQPTSFFTIDSRINGKIRELVSEAEGCREMNFLVGASGALRKAIYEFLEHQGAEGVEYKDKIKWLKSKYPQIEESYFDALSGIQGMTSENLHESSSDWKPWSNSDLNFLISVVKKILEEVYVIPEERKKDLEKINSLKSRSSFKSK